MRSSPIGKAWWRKGYTSVHLLARRAFAKMLNNIDKKKWDIPSDYFDIIRGRSGS